MSTQAEALEKLRIYANQLPREVESFSSTDQAAREAQLSKTVTNLQQLVDEQQLTLEKVLA